MQSRWFLKGLALTVAVALFTAVPMVPEAVGKAKPIKIGVADVLGGGGAVYALPGIAGNEMAVAEINAAGGVLGRPLKLIVRDTKIKPDVAVRVARELILKDDVDFLVGSVGSHIVLAISEVAKEYKKIYMVDMGKSEKATIEKWHPYIFRVGGNTGMIGRAVAIQAAKKPWKKYYLIGPDYEFGHRMVEDFVNKLKELRPDVEIVGEAWPKLFTGDFSSYITAIMKTAPDAVYSSLWGGDEINFIKQAKPYGLFDKINFMVLGDLDVLVPLGDETPEGLWLFTWYSFTYPESKEHDAWVQEVLNKTGKYPTSGSMWGYMAIKFLAAAIEKAGTVDNEKVRKALEGMTLDSVIGPITIRKIDHESVWPSWFGKAKKSEKYPFAVMSDVVLVPGSEVIMPEDKVLKMREK